MFGNALYYSLCGVLSLGVLLGIFLMSKVKKSVLGNRLSAVCMALAIILTLLQKEIFDVWFLYVMLVVGSAIGVWLAVKVKMIQMPQMVALLNGLGGGASAIVGAITMFGIGINPSSQGEWVFSMITAALALAVGVITLIGSLVAAGKLHKVINQKSVVYPGHQFITVASAILMLAGVVAFGVMADPTEILGLGHYTVVWVFLAFETVFSAIFGYFFSIRVGGADMPITISLLNSLSGVAGAIAGLAINDLLLVAVGGIVGASGLLLTQVMCRSMNRKLMDILLGKTSAKHSEAPKVAAAEAKIAAKPEAKKEESDPIEVLRNAKDVIIVPGYGMAIAQAQHLVKQLADTLVGRGARVRYAVHPVAGRMPGHMNVLLCEANVDYEDLYEMDNINDDFAKADATIVVGANDVMNPAAREAEGTPIYGMPVLNVDKCKNVFVFNYDTKPGYAGVENPLYTREGVHLFLGNAADTLGDVLNALKNGGSVKKSEAKIAAKPESKKEESDPIEVLRNAKDVIIVPGYGMAIAQAQHLVKQLADTLVGRGARVRYAVHPVAGRMPGHMNVLLCEANVDYEDLYEMDNINDDFAKADATIVVGANDVMNPAAREAEGTPIYGMPVLNVDKCKNVFVFNYDTKPGYAGVENPLYTREGVHLFLGNAADTLGDVLNKLK